ncbi:hypothetical protein Pmani_028595 [Petrolisthes manimaculis]|uniref:Uncharacterized protein n=1 Tax=Petrolisthes manimaculis TaxID=1843537 RepID=A0AAE1P1Y5_9EUCA|nr:hypothetical protein Pmani_028595 [Petrolisthes manimaculis]
MVFRKNDAWMAKFDTAIKSLGRTGIIEHWLKTEIRSLMHTFELHDDGGQGVGAGKESPLNTNHLQCLFLLMGIAWVVSCGVFGYEMMHKSYCCSLLPTP